MNTLKVTGVSLACGLALGLALALMRLSRHRLASWPAGFVIEVFRTTPPLVQLFWFFFALPLIVGIEMTPFLAAVRHLLDPVGGVLRRGVPRRHPSRSSAASGTARARSA